MQKWHKNILGILLILSFIIALCFSSSCIEFLYDLSMAVFTSIAIFFFIDYVIEKYNKKEEEKKLKVVIGKITPSINKFYKYFVALYAGTRESQISEDDPILKNIFHQKEELYQSIVKNLRYKEESPFVDVDKFNIEDFFNKKSINYLTWKKAWLNQYSSLYQDLLYFQMYYGIFLSSELLSKLESLIEVFNNFFLQHQNMERAGAKQIALYLETNETFYEIIKLKEIMTLFESFVKSLEEESGIDFMSIKDCHINNRDEHPLLGALLNTQTDKKTNI